MKITFKKRVFSLLLAMLMVVTMVPTFVIPASAATAVTTSVTGLGASWDYTSTNKNGTVTANGDTITIKATGGSLRTTTIKLTLTNNLGEEATLRYSYTNDGGSLSDAKDEHTLANGASATIKFTSGRNQTNYLYITGISLISNTAADPTITFKSGANGSYTVNGTVITADTEMTVAAGTNLALAATPASGYQFFGWQKADGTYLSQNAGYTMTAGTDETITPVFIPDSVALFGVGAAKYDNLTKAGAAAAAGTNKTIILLNNGTVSGSHTIPKGTTLLIPYDDGNTQYGGEASCTSYSSILNNSGHKAWESPTAYRTMTLAGDAKISVNGNIEVGGRHAAAGGTVGKYGGSPTGKLGYINMLSGSHIDLNNGANLYCWGYIYGDGTITAKNGASIYENFQIMDFRGGTATSQLASEYLVFPLSQYYVQNVEVATRYEYGSTEYIATSIFMSNQKHSATVKFIGTNAMFQPTSGSYFIKDYNPTTDMLEMHAYGDSSMSSMNLELGGTAINSSEFVLPITNNIQIYLHAGTTTLKQNMMMLPGSSLTIDKDATLNLAYTDATGEVVTTGGYVLQVFDSENQTKALNMDTLETETGLLWCQPSKQFAPLEYICTSHKVRTTADLTDVTIDINGTIVTNGFMYSTVSWADASNEDFTIVSGGANVISSGKTGVVAMNNGAGEDQLGYMFDQSKNKGGGIYYYIPLASVQLKNGDGTLVDTTGAEPGTIFNYCSTHDCWYTGECEACEAPPTEYKITWNINGEEQSVDAKAGEVPVYPGTAAPSKSADNSGHYTFAGWSSTNGGAVEALPAVSGEATYYAVFTREAHIDNVKDTQGSYHLCDKCSYNLGSHSDTSPIDHYCDSCGKKMSDHEGGSATCKDQAVCTKCNQPYGAFAGHNAGQEKDEDIVAPTCGAAGSHNVVVRCTVCNTIISSTSVTDPATGLHTDKDGDGNHACDVCETVIENACVGGTPVKEKITDATCSADGSYQEVVYCTECGEEMSRDDKISGAFGHTWNATAYVWSDDGKTCTASRTCATDGTHTETATAVISSEITTDATCTAMGITTYTATFDVDWATPKTKDVQDVSVKSHNYNAVITPPTCIADGYTTYTCDACGYTYTADEVAALGHTKGEAVVENKVDSTCYAEGSYDEVVYCSVCGAELSRVTKTIASKAHTAGEAVVENKVDSTCYAEGSYDEVVYCSVCEATGKTEEMSRVTKTIAKKAHTAGEAVVENKVDSTCYAEGSYDEVVYCSVCGAELSRVTTTVDALGHKHNAVVTAPTCTDKGYTTYTCACGDSYVADEVPASEHTWDDGVIDPDSTCTAEGTKTFTCSVCGATKTEVVSVKGHKYNAVVTAPTCTVDGYTTYTCSACGDTYKADYVDANGHDYDAVVTAPTCTDKGYTTYTCACGDSYVADEVPASEHTWDDGVIDPDSTCNKEGTKTFTCSKCGDTRTEVVKVKGHTKGEAVTENEVAASCENTGSYDTVVYCSVCGAEISRETVTVPAAGHGKTVGFTYDDNGDGTHNKICADCGVTVEAVAHTYDVYTHKCDCEAVEEFLLTVKDWSTEEVIFAEISVPYDSSLEEYLDGVNVHDIKTDDGTYKFNGEWLAEGANEIPATMPGEDLTVYAYMTFTGWFYANGNYGYMIDNDEQIGWLEVDGAWYYLDPNASDEYQALRATGITRAPYPTVPINGVTYEADKETLDYCQNKGVEFIDAESAFFVFGDDGKFNSVTGIVEGNRYALNGMISWHPGLVDIDGEYYYFIGDNDNGGNKPANGDTYLTRTNDIAGFRKTDVYNFADGKFSGHNGIVDGKYYENSRLMVGNGLTKLTVNGEAEYIYVRSNGKVVVSASYWIGSNGYNIVPGSYDFDADGYMIDVKTTEKNGIYYENGKYCYYENGVRAYKGLVKYTGVADNGTAYENDWIYVRSSGELAVGEYWTTKNDYASEMQTKLYIFDETGAMIRTNGIVEEGGNLYYYVDGVKQKCLGLIKLDGKYYYVRTAGELVRSRNYWITNVNDTGIVAQSYYFNDKGEMQNPVLANNELTNGVVDGYYYADGKIAYGAGLVKLDDGSIIYVRSNGKLATGIYWPTVLNGVLPAGKYDFGTDGRLVVA